MPRPHHPVHTCSPPDTHEPEPEADQPPAPSLPGRQPSRLGRAPTPEEVGPLALQDEEAGEVEGGLRRPLLGVGNMEEDLLEGDMEEEEKEAPMTWLQSVSTGGV